MSGRGYGDYFGRIRSVRRQTGGGERVAQSMFGRAVSGVDGAWRVGLDQNFRENERNKALIEKNVFRKFPRK